MTGELRVPDSSGFYPQHGGGWILLGPIDAEGRATFALAAVTRSSGKGLRPERRSALWCWRR